MLKPGFGVGQSQAIAFIALAGLFVPADQKWLAGLTLLILGIGIIWKKKPWLYLQQVTKPALFVRLLFTPLLAVTAGLFWTFGYALFPEVAPNISLIAWMLLLACAFDIVGVS